LGCVDGGAVVVIAALCLFLLLLLVVVNADSRDGRLQACRVRAGQVKGDGLAGGGGV
jgi:hypothetical protein